MGSCTRILSDKERAQCVNAIQKYMQYRKYDAGERSRELRNTVRTWLGNEPQCSRLDIAGRPPHEVCCIAAEIENAIRAPWIAKGRKTRVRTKKRKEEQNAANQQLKLPI